MVIKDNIVYFSLEKLFTDIQDQDDIPQLKFKRKSAKRSFTCDIADKLPTINEPRLFFQVTLIGLG
jgi:hypothetical protein